MKVIIPMAGLGSRFTKAGYKDHKPLIRVAGKTLIRYTVESLNLPRADYVFVLRDLGGSYIEDLKSELDACSIAYRLVVIDKLTSGSAETALIGLDKDYHGELIVTNCDQFLEWDSEQFLYTSRQFDASVLTYKSRDPKNSYAELSSNGNVARLVEKNPISDRALVGVHYWKTADDFRNSTEFSLRNLEVGRESYVSETMNYLGTTKQIAALDINGKYWSTGTPEDLAKFKGYLAEYKSPKPNTYMIDLDGTIFTHAHKYSNLPNAAVMLPGVREALDELDSKGHQIILMSARPESARALTEKILHDLVIPYRMLILGVTQGNRIVVNDIMSPTSKSRCEGINVITDRGWTAQDVKG